jgi:hypothetical protein
MIRSGAPQELSGAAQRRRAYGTLIKALAQRGGGRRCTATEIFEPRTKTKAM